MKCYLFAIPLLLQVLNAPVADAAKFDVNEYLSSIPEPVKPGYLAYFNSPVYRIQEDPGNFTGEAGYVKPNGYLTEPGKNASTLLPEAVADALYSIVGPYFGNALFNNTLNETIPDIHGKGTCLKCAWTIHNTLPCVRQTYKDKNLFDMTKCGIPDYEVCKCVNCYPRVISSLLHPVFCDNQNIYDPDHMDQIYPKPFPVSYELTHIHTLGSSELNDKAAFGIITVSEIEYAKEDKLRNAHVLKPGEQIDVSLGTPCGNANCGCLGFCLFGKCVGACI